MKKSYNKESPIIHDITDFELQQIIYGLKYRQKAHVRKTPTHEEIHISRMIHFFENLNKPS
jgi:hypothetical protein